ncbi:MAG: acetyl-CoA carboxylase biotin carboxyl carrier protein [Chitinophagales bacterium]
MDFKQIQELIKLVNKSNIGEVTVEEKGFKITVKQKEEHIQQVMAAPVASPSFSPAYAPPQSNSGQSGGSGSGKQKAADTAADNLITIKSPMIGTFYRGASPEKPAFVNVGDETEPGKVVCIIEAMKLFNEIESEVKGKIVKVLVEDASPVEFDQPLFLVDPS